MNKKNYKKKYKELKKVQKELHKDHKDSMQRLEDSMRELEKLIGPSDSKRSSESHQLYTDGAAEFDDNYKPINAAIGGLLKKGDKVIFSFAENIGSGRTSNEAEYLALIKGIQECIEHKIYDVNICADSKLVVNQVNGKYKLKDPKMIKLHGEVVKLCSKLQSWNISHIIREKNTEADDLSKKGLRK